MSLFVTFEGIEGSGKSTQLRLLVERLRAAGRDVVGTREPGGTSLGRALRALLLDTASSALTPTAELLLYCADRAQHVAEVIAPALAAGRMVVCDRFSDSTLAYQGYGRELDVTTIRELDAHARGGVAPGLTFLLDCPVDEGLRRARARSHDGDRFENAAREFHARVRAGFQALAAAEPARIHVLDATAPTEQVHALVWAETARRLGTAA